MARAGDVIGGKYRLIHPLGIGGMGAVWRAEHTVLMQQVAVKLLDARGPAADRAVKRFKREAQIAASVRHRNIVYISDFGTDQGAPYLVMELLSGVPLSERIVVGDPLTVSAFLRLILETLDGLAAVHAAGVVHRDMKPENIFLVRDGATFFPKLLDFGVSRSTERGQGHTITREGIVMGTPEYVSPEQARGKMADARSDIYSLGVVIYEALAGRLPFQADNPADLIVSVLNADALPLFVLRPDLGEELSAIVSKAMARNPVERFHAAEELRAALDACLSAHPDYAELSLPRRFVAPPPTATPQSAAPPPTASDGSELVPTRAESYSSNTPSLAPFVRGPRRRALTVGFGAAAVLVAGLAIALASSGEPNTQARAAAAEKPSTAPVAPSAPAEAKVSEVYVELFGVPSNAVVLADGVVVEGTKVSLPRGTGAHEIVVQADGKEAWRVMHDSARDGRYALALEPLQGAKPSNRVERPSRDKPSSKPKRPPSTSLVRTPDF